MKHEVRSFLDTYYYELIWYGETFLLQGVEDKYVVKI